MADTIQNINLKELSSAMSQIGDEKGLKREKLIEIVGDALAAAYKKDYGKKGQIIKAEFDPKSQTARFYKIKEVVDETSRIFEPKEETEEEENKEKTTTEEELAETIPRFNEERDILLSDAQKIKKEVQVGDEIKIKLKSQNKFGRVAAQNAKQVIIQKLREAERETLYEEFKNREGEIVTATVQRIENRNVYLDLGKMVGVLFPSEQVAQENYRPGQRIKVYIEKVDKDSRDTTVSLSRSNPNLVKKLFALEVPEIFSGSVVIELIAREPGSRSKIAVKSKEEGIDPIGSCVGQKGIRVQAIIDELGGEKIDIIEYNKDPQTFITHALSPAKVNFVEIYEKEKRAVANVEADQLSLAIGKRGQNVRLAAKLTGWKIDVVDQEGNGGSFFSEETAPKEKEPAEEITEEPETEVKEEKKKTQKKEKPVKKVKENPVEIKK